MSRLHIRGIAWTILSHNRKAHYYYRPLQVSISYRVDNTYAISSAGKDLFSHSSVVKCLETATEWILSQHASQLVAWWEN